MGLAHGTHNDSRGEALSTQSRLPGCLSRESPTAKAARNTPAAEHSKQEHTSRETAGIPEGSLKGALRASGAGVNYSMVLVRVGKLVVAGTVKSHIVRTHKPVWNNCRQTNLSVVLSWNLWV